MRFPINPSALFLTAISLWPGIWASGQYQVGLNVDSLKNALANMADNATRARTLITLGQQYENNHPDSAIYFYEQAGALSKRLGDMEGVVRYINNYTAVLNMQGHFDQSLALNLQAVQLCKQHGLDDLLTLALINVGVVYQQKEDYPQALEWYLQALPRIEAAGHSQRLSIFYGNLCGLYRNLHQSEKALAYARKSLVSAEHIGDNFAVGSACINLANVIKDTGELEKAIPYLQQARTLGMELNDLNMLETALINLGDVYLQSNQPKRYVPLYAEALPLAEALGDVSGQAFARLGIALGYFWKQQYQQAEDYLRASLQFARQHDQKEPLSRMLLLMADVQIALSKPRLATPYRNQYDSLSRELAGIALQQHIQELETKYGMERQRRTMLQQRQWLLIAAGAVAVLVILLSLGYYAYRQRQKLNAKALQAMEAEQETMRLKAKLQGEHLERRRIIQEMHDDMGAGLTRMLFLSRALSGADEAVDKIKDTAQSLVKKMNEIIWTMDDEESGIDSLAAYIHVTTAELLENTGIDYRYEVAEPLPDIALSQAFRRNIFLVVKEAMHNVVKHARATRVAVSIRADSVLRITIHDNGKGIDVQTGRRFGNGLRNMQQRIEKINGRLEITVDHGTLVYISVPLPV